MNCVAHKDYASAVPIQISVFPDHITFWNAGQLPEAGRPKNFLKATRPLPITR